jgi:NADH-quinone oxidoreductase subunit A
MTLPAYLPILFLVILAAGFAAGSMLVASKVSPLKRSIAKEEPYECGIVPDPQTLPDRERFPIKFYLLAMLFIVFDIETVFLYPWAVAYKELKVFGLVEMLGFIGVLFAAYIYVWKRGGLDWAE